MPVSSARVAALYEIDARSLPGWPPKSMKQLRRPKLTDSRDIDLCEQITRGVVKSCLTLQHLVQIYSGRSLDQIEPSVQKIVAMALFQMRALDRIPTHAIVDDAVEITRVAHVGNAAGFVNAILRKAADSRAAAPESTTADPVKFAAEAHSFPPDCFRRLQNLLDDSAALSLCERLNHEPPLLARLIGTTTIEQIREAGGDVMPHQKAGIVVVSNPRREQLKQWADARLCQPQDPTSVAAVGFLDLKPGVRVLDRCAGRGTKTLQIIEQIGKNDLVVAIDPSNERLESLRVSLRQMKLTNVRTIEASNCDPIAEETFDRILIDAPCGNSGVMSRRPEARYRQSQHDVSKVVELQRRILDDSLRVLAPRGRMVYATCSIWPEENEKQIAGFLKENPSLKLISQATTMPNPAAEPFDYCDGGYVAVMSKLP